MNLTVSLARAVALMLLYIIPAFLIRKLNLVGEEFPLVFSKVLLYALQPFMFIKTSLVEYTEGSWKGFLIIAGISLVVMFVALRVILRLFGRAPESRRKVLQFASVFGNVGNFGIPIIIYTLGYEYAFYVQGCILSFNLVTFSYGRYIYTDDPKYKSLYYALVNPSSIPLMLGLLIYFTGSGTWVVNHLGMPGFGGAVLQLFYDMTGTFSDMVAPVSMMIVGARLADLELKGLMRDGNMYLFLGLRAFAMPAFSYLLTLPLRALGACSYEFACVLIIIMSAPCASLATVFAELYGGDSVYSSKLTAISTLASVVTMPLVVALFCH